jgi:hypothetical protein
LLEAVSFIAAAIEQKSPVESYLATHTEYQLASPYSVS